MFPTLRQPALPDRLPAKRPGKLIVLYGINNLGKSTQAKLLVEMIKAHGKPAEYLKYPAYDVIPSGVLINDFLRKGNFHQLSPREAQIVYALNRSQVEPGIVRKLEAGIHVVAEDYTGTGIAWGIGAGVNEEFLKFINSHLLKEDVAILMDGERFIEAREAGHHHEKNDELTERVRGIHRRLGDEYGWHVVDANQPIEAVQQAIWQFVKPIVVAGSPGSGSLQDTIAAAHPDPGEKVAVTHINAAASHVDIKNGRPHQPYAIPHRLPSPGRTVRRLPGAPADAGELPLQRLTPTARLPRRAHADDAGLDLFSDGFYTLYPGQRARIRTGIAAAIPAGHAGLIWDKSGLAAKGLKTAGGVIDAGYRGEIQIVAINLSDEILEIDRGQKVAQLLIQEIKTPTPIEVGELENTERGKGSFGSTGLH